MGERSWAAIVFLVIGIAAIAYGAGLLRNTDAAVENEARTWGFSAPLTRGRLKCAGAFLVFWGIAATVSAVLVLL